jgi:hypothetical protein
MSQAIFDVAVACAVRGIPVFPCKPGRKEPLTPHGLHDASADLDDVFRWWRNCPDANVAMPTGKTSADVLDIDNHGDAGNGFGALRRIRDAGLATGAHRLVKTPRGGLHLYFRPSGCTNHSLRRHHVDTRGDGGYVLLPPSIVNGSRYELLEDRDDATGTLDWESIARLLEPPRVSRFATPSREQMTGNMPALVKWLSVIKAGGRNNALFWTCCRAAESGVTDLAALEPLVDVAVALGLTRSEAEATAKSALRRHHGVAA